MGQMVGAALVSHHPGLMQCEEFRRAMGAGEDSDLIAGYARLRDKLAAARPDVVVVFDSHWFTTGDQAASTGSPRTRASSTRAMCPRPRSWPATSRPSR